MVDDDEVSEEEGEEPELRSPKPRGDKKRRRLHKAREELGAEAMDEEDLELVREAQGASVSQSRNISALSGVGNPPLVSGRDMGVDEFDSEDDGDFIVDDLGMAPRRGARGQQKR